MVWRIGVIASLFVTFASFTTNLPALSEQLAKATRIASYQANFALGNVTFKTSPGAVLSPPRIRYMTISKGETLLMADFPDLFYPFQPQSLRPEQDNSKSRSINTPAVAMINFGQFQANPAIFRIAVKSERIDVLEKISFRADGEGLVMSWSDPSRSQPVKATSVELPSSTQDHSSNHEALRLVFSTSQYEPEAQNDISLHSLNSSASPTQPEQDSRIRPLPDLSNDKLNNFSQDSEIAPSIEIEPPSNNIDMAGKTRVRISGKQKLTVSAFRLHDPERYVVDFDNLPLLTGCQIPSPQNGSPFKTMRVGSPQGKATVSRLVFDLASKECSVHSELLNSASQLLLTFNKSGNVSVKGPLPHGMQIVLDPGHGGSDPGARRQGIEEKELTLSIVSALKRRLEDRGVKVVLTRFDDTFVSLEDRVKLTNTIAPNLFLSVHINSLPSDSDIHGIETYYQTGQSKPFADTIHDCLVNNLEAPDRYVRKARFYVINHTPVPAVLAEVGFISCKDERERLISFDYQDRIAKALEQGVILYLVKQNQLAQAGPAAANADVQDQRSY